ncbi:hypothetical protein [Actinoallomurus sp. NPDC050550]|uniref:hypothetical protein n=1 Tax=Actinoallomurus sp. NPDC050550 TaxID=3154937 RepID=UPI00340E5110
MPNASSNRPGTPDGDAGAMPNAFPGAASRDTRASSRRRTAAAAVTGLVLGLLALGPALAPGFVLAYDMVFVPRPVFERETFGLTGMLPRHVPSDAVVTALAHLAPADLVQKAILLAIFVIACVSAAALVSSERLTARLAGGVVYAWNPFVAERLLLGQWALLLGYAALPWVVRAAARGDPRRLVLALVPAAIGGFAAMAVSGLVVLVLSLRRRSIRWPLAVLVVMSLPWIVPSLLRFSGVPADPAGVAAFAARADTPFGELGSLLLLGGAWNAETVPPGYGAAVTAVLWLCVVVLALVVYARGSRASGARGVGSAMRGGAVAGVRRLGAAMREGAMAQVRGLRTAVRGDAAARMREPGTAAFVDEAAWVRGLGTAAVVGLVVAALGAVVPGVLRGVIGLWPGFAVLRDGQQYVAPLALVVAVGMGTAVDALSRGRGTGISDADARSPIGRPPRTGSEPGRSVSRTAARPGASVWWRLPRSGDAGRPELAVLGLLAPVALLPGLAWGAGGRLHAVRYPADWARARAVVQTAPGDVLVLPWEAYRSYAWNGGRRVLDPLPRFLPGRVIVNDAVRVGTGGRELRMEVEDRRARALDPLIRSGAPLTGALRSRGVRYVAVDAPDGVRADRLPGAERVVAGPDLVLYRIPGAAASPETRTPQWPVEIAWFITFTVVLWSTRLPVGSLIARSLPKEP